MLLVSSAAAERVERARAWLVAQRPDAEVVVVAASMEAANRLCRLAGDGARFGWHRFTLASLAARLGLGELAAAGRVAIGGLSRQAMCARLVRTLRGELGPLDRVADAPGLACALAATLDEIRMAGLAPADLATPLARIAAADEHELERAGLADRASIHRAAITAASTHPLARLPLLLLDPPLHSRLEGDLVAALAAASPAVLATCPAGDDETLARLRQSLGEPTACEPPARPRTLARVQDHLFAGTVSAETGDESVAVIASPGEAREAVEIARGILAEAARGTRFEEMAVLLRAGELYREPLREAFRRAGIPAYFTKGTVRPDTAGRALLALLACRAEQLSATRFSEYLSLGVVPAFDAPPAVPWVPPDDVAFVPDGAPDAAGISDEAHHPGWVAPRLWERLIADAAVVGRGVERWRRRLAGLRESLEDERRGAEAAEVIDALGARLRALESLERFAVPLLEELDALPERMSWAGWLDALRRLAIRAIDEPTHVLTVLAELAPLGEIGPVDLDEVRLVLEERLTTLLSRPSEQPAGKVFVAAIDEARGQCFEVVFAPGLAERVFPPVVREDPLLLDAVRARLDAGLATQAVRIARERLALRLAAGAASRRLVISYPRLDDEKGRSRVPSFYGLEILRAAEGQLPRFDELSRRAGRGAADRMGWPAPLDPAEAIDAAEFDLAVLGRLLWGDRAIRAGATAYLLEASPHLARSLRARYARWEKPSWSRADGVWVGASDAHPGARAALARRHIHTRAYAPTSLEQFATCPYRFYLRAVAGLVDREDASEIEKLDARQRGQLIHTIQRRILGALRLADLLPLSRPREAEILACGARVVEEVAEAWREDHAPAIERIYRDTVDEIASDIRQWLLRLLDEPRWQPAHAELAFGLRRDESHDPASRAEPVIVEGMLLRGAIDLVERDGERLRATDHKTGRRIAPRGFVIAGGTILQPVIYALALEAMTGAPVEGGRLSHATTRGGFVSFEVALDDRARAAFARFARTIQGAFDKGWFPAAPTRDACGSCAYRAICGPHEEIRTKKKKPRLALLDNLRSER